MSFDFRKRLGLHVPQIRRRGADDSTQTSV